MSPAAGAPAAAMHWLTLLFISTVAASAAAELWLAHRQIAALAAHRGHVPGAFAARISIADHRKAADYATGRIRLGRIDSLLGAAVTLALTVGGGIAALDGVWRMSGWRQPWLGAAVIASVGAAIWLIHLPLSLWRTFRLEARFGFNRTTPLLFLLDLCKGLLLTALIGAPLLLATLALMQRTGRWWWTWVWGVWLCVTLLMSWAWPVLIAPLFNRFSPLEDPTLRARIEALLERCGFRSSGVFVVDGSRRSSHSNAYFTGLGRSKRIVFFDTLLKQLAPGEIEAVLAHELGHFRLKHIRQRLLVSSLSGLAGLGLFGWLAARPGFYAALGVAVPSRHAELLLLVLLAPLPAFFATPLAALWSRRHEYQADRFAALHASARDLTTALVTLYRDNASTLTPDRIYAAFYYSHPPAIERIQRLQAAA